MQRLLKSFIVLMSVGGVISHAHADDEATERARKHYQQAQKEYDLGNWDAAAREFSWAYELRPDPIFLYDMAQSYRRAGNTQRAIDLYKNYLLKDPKSSQRAEVEQRIARLQKQLEDERAARAGAAALAPEPAPAIAPQPEPSAEAPTETAPPTTEPPQATRQASPAPSVAAPASAEPSSLAAAPSSAGTLTHPAVPPVATGRGLRMAGLATGAAGLSAIGAGVYFSLRTRSLSDSVTNASRFSPADAQSGKNAQVLQWVCYGAGAAALVTGALLYWTGHTRRAQASAIALAPLVASDEVGVVAAGTF